ncbi:hypothetical protein HYQ44_004699 [Verticillium longisporum]|nr:hypothetical protein HYQ44_004699 [Verticillium longisporum]
MRARAESSLNIREAPQFVICASSAVQIRQAHKDWIVLCFRLHMESCGCVRRDGEQQRLRLHGKSQATWCQGSCGLEFV